MAKITKRTKKDGTCSYCIRVSNGYDRQGRAGVGKPSG